MLHIDALLFDLDGTLIDSKKDIALAVHHLQKKYGRPPSPDEEIARFIGDGVGKLVERAIGKTSKAEMEKAITLFKAYYRAHALDHTRAYTGVDPTLAHFHSKKMAVITNKPARISNYILVRLGLARYFPVILGGDSVVKKKPHPEGIFLALDRLGVRQTRDVLIVGDSFQDVLAGRAAGIRTCGIFSNIGDPDLLRQSVPDFTVPSLPDLMRIIN